MEIRRFEVANAILIGEIKKTIQSGKSAKFLVTGHSMRLFLKNRRDYVYLSPVNVDKLRVHDVVLAQITPNYWVLHRIIRIDGDHLTLMGDGNIGLTEQCTKADVIGKATAFYRKGRDVPDYLDGKKWKIYSYIWLHLTPIRGFILALVRRLPFNI